MLMAMKPVQEMVYATPGYSFCIQRLEHRRLHFNWHYHEDVELILIARGEGHIHVGDLVKAYKAPAGFLIGPALPHAFLSIDTLDGWIIQFPAKHISYANAPSEFAAIVNALAESKKGLSFSPSTVMDCLPALRDMDCSVGLEKWLEVLKILNMLGQDEDREFCSLVPHNLDGQADHFEQAITQVYNTIDKAHSLEDISKTVGMKVGSFCKAFRKRYGLSFVEYVHSIRITIAKKLLIQTQFYIDDICYESGFNNVSFFNRKFKEATGLTPSQYRKRYRET